MLDEVDEDFGTSDTIDVSRVVTAAEDERTRKEGA